MPPLPLFPLDTVLFPGTPLPLHIFEPRYKEMIGECLQQEAPFGVVRVKEQTMAETGCTAHIVKVVKRYEDGRMDIVTQGLRRFEIIQPNEERSFLQAEVRLFEDEPAAIVPGESDELVRLHTEIVTLFDEKMQLPEDRSQLSFQLAATLPLDLDFKQLLLEMRSEAQRQAALIKYYRALLPRLERAVRVRRKSGGNGHVV